MCIFSCYLFKSVLLVKVSRIHEKSTIEVPKFTTNEVLKRKLGENKRFLVVTAQTHIIDNTFRSVFYVV